MGNTLAFRIALFLVSFFVLNSASAQTPIHKCESADGGIEYSQLPCVPQQSVESEKSEPDTKVERPTLLLEKPALEKETPVVVTAPQQTSPQSNSNSSACKKRYRDAIDTIDAEIGREYTADKAEQYKQRLLLLTRKLRQC